MADLDSITTLLRLNLLITTREDVTGPTPEGILIAMIVGAVVAVVSRFLQEGFQLVGTGSARACPPRRPMSSEGRST